MNEVQEAMAAKDQYEDLKGKTIDHIECNGGIKYGTRISLYFVGGEVLHIQAELDSSKHSIYPRICRQIGQWGRIDSIKFTTEKS